MASKEEVLQRLFDWQACGYVHPLTCRIEKCRSTLIPEVIDNEPALVCPHCGHIQIPVPPMFFDDTLAWDYLKKDYYKEVFGM